MAGLRRTRAGAWPIELAGAASALGAVEVVLLVEGGLQPLWAILLFPLVASIYVAAGLLAWTRRPSNLLGPLLVAGGFVWLGAGFGNTEVKPLIAIGLILQTAPLAVVVHLLLSFPGGRLRGRASQVTVATAYFVVLVLQAPSYLFDQGAPGPEAMLAVADRHDLVLAGFWLQNVVGTGVMVATSVILAGRLRAAEPAKRRVLRPLSVYGILAVIFVPVGADITRAWFPDEGVTLLVTQAAVMAGVPIAFVTAALRGGFARSGEIDELGAWLGSEPGGRPGLETALREALGDPTLSLLFWVAETGSYVDGEGHAQAAPTGIGRRAEEVRLLGRRVGAIVYDTELVDDAGLVASAAQVVALALDHERLTAELLASREGLRVSRARLVEATDAERRRIVRDLHDGLQARLVTLAIAAGRIELDQPAAAGLRVGLQEAVAELRELVHGVVPAALTERGLYAAAEEIADRMPIPVELELEEPAAALPPAVESAGFFVVSEALANAVKHARAEELRVRIGRRDGHLRIEVGDDGIGGARLGDGSGLRGIADRLEALEGRLLLDSPLGGGTVVVAEVPCGW